MVPCYRGAATLARALDSVRRQTLRPAEVIVVDDASDDGTREVLERLAFDGNLIRFETNRGPAAARNAGWDAALQRYVAFLDADDAWHPRKLELQAAWMDAHPEAALSAHRYGMNAVSHEGGAFGVLAITPGMLLASSRFAPSTVMLRRELPQRFAEDKRHSEDRLLWLEIALSGASLFRLEAELAVRFRPAFGAGGLSGELWRMEAGELDAFGRLRRSGRIGAAAWAAAVAWSWAKFARRLCVVAVRGRA